MNKVKHATQEWTNNNFTNALKKTKSGCPLILDDISPAEHTILAAEDVGATSMVRCGRNLYPGDNQLNFTGKNSFSFDCISIPTPFTISLDITVESIAKAQGATFIQFVYEDGSTTAIALSSWAPTLGVTKRVKNTQKGNGKILIKINFLNWPEMTGTVSNIQIELGEIEHEFEPHIEPIVYESNQDIIKIPSLYPTTVLYEIGGGGTVTAEYHRDINKAFAELQNAFLSLGGNI